MQCGNIDPELCAQGKEQVEKTYRIASPRNGNTDVIPGPGRGRSAERNPGLVFQEEVSSLRSPD